MSSAKSRLLRLFPLSDTLLLLFKDSPAIVISLNSLLSLLGGRFSDILLLFSPGFLGVSGFSNACGFAAFHPGPKMIIGCGA